MGITKITKIAKELNISVAEVVYGREHVKKFHKSLIYKPRYLKTMDPKSGRMFAFPDGLPGFQNIEKIHLMGHSMGALTSREF